jgi:hypothetical protein
MSDSEDEEEINDIIDQSEELSVLYRLDERTKNIQEELEDQSVRLFEVKKNTQENRRKIARIRGGLVVIGLIVSAIVAGIVSYFLGLVKI